MRIRPDGPVGVTEARSTPFSRARARTEGLACTGGGGSPAGGEGAAGTAAVGSGCADTASATVVSADCSSPPATSMVAMIAPLSTTWFSATSTSRITPVKGEGRSITAFSLSSASSGSSWATSCPARIKTSTTVIFWTLPKSGMRMVCKFNAILPMSATFLLNVRLSSGLTSMAREPSVNCFIFLGFGEFCPWGDFP